MNLPAFTFKTSMQLFAAIIALYFLSACHKQEPRKNEISKIELATGNCFGPCQRTAISIDSTLAYKFYGGGLSFPLPPGKDSIVSGYYNGQISQKLWDTLNDRLTKIHYQQLDTSYQEIADAQSVEVVIRYNGRIKHIKTQYASMPDSVRQVFHWIAESYRQVKLKPIKDSIQFETSIQKSLWWD
jgi:hypothetical protein